MSKSELTSYGENVAAISAMIHEDPAQYQAICDNLPDDVGGPVGIWSICADAGEVFTKQEAPYTAGEDFYWIEAIEIYAKTIEAYLKAGHIPTKSSMQRSAADAIKQSMITDEPSKGRSI